MKRYIISLFTAILSMVCLTGCLTSGIDDPEEVFDGANITGVQGIYYRYINADGNVQQVRLAMGSDINNDEQTVEIVYLLPSNFPQDQVDKFSLKSVVVVLNISTAATIRPIGDSPKLGLPGDWTMPNQYEVTAANGDKKIWTVTLELYEE